ncbi:MAG: MFS transporter, partial [Gammaproteobacteria bacterium]|nr:MFS transporter [Gammaproteobacteria bacterium]
LYLGFTMIDLPHKAWGAELSTDYDERSRITGIREGLSTAGQVLLLAALVWLAAQGVTDDATQLRGIAMVIAVGLPVLVAFALLRVLESPAEGFPHASRSYLQGLKIVARNPALLRMIGCVMFFVSGIVIQGTLHRLVLADVMAAEARFPLMILIENVATLAAVPVWLAISRRTSKHRALIGAALWLAALSLPLVFLREGQLTELIIVVALRGSSFASILFLSNSIAADVIDVDTLEAGEQRSGLLFAVWGMTIKLAVALGVVLGTSLPALFGYEPSAEIITADIQARLMLVYGFVPAVMMAIGALFLRGFPITRERQAAVRRELSARGAVVGSSPSGS